MYYSNIAQIKLSNTNSGRFWFSPDTVRFFDSRVESRVYDAGDNPDYPDGSRLWIESTTNYDDSAREYKIARFDVSDADISYVGVDHRTLRFARLSEARHFLEENLL